MRRAFLRLLLPFLLLAQVTVGMSPGHAICIALDACCGGHVHAELIGFVSHDDHHAHGHPHVHACPDGCTNACCASQADGAVAHACDGDCSEGSSHFHLALPDDGGCMRDRSSDHLCDLRLMSPALAISAADAVVTDEPQAILPPPWSWPDCDRLRALETDCLLI